MSDTPGRDRGVRRRRGRPLPVASMMGRFVRRLSIGPVLEVVKAWPLVAGPLVSAHLQAVRFSDGTLFVKADQSVWSHQLTFLKPELLRRFEEALGKRAVTDIRLSLAAPGPGQPALAPPGGIPLGKPGPRAPSEPLTVEPMDLPPGEVAAIEERALATIRNPDLARRWARLEARVRGAQLARKALGQQICPKCGVPHPGPDTVCPVCYRQNLPPVDPMRPI